MDNEKLLELAGVWFTGVATWGAVAAALGLPRLYRPKLRAICDLDSFACSTFVSEWPALGSGVEELWVKLGVVNESNSTAEDVQVRVIMVIRDALSERPNYRSYSSWWLKLSGMSAIAISIPPRFTQFVDLCFIHVPAEPKASLKLVLAAVRSKLQPWEAEHRRLCESPSLTLTPNGVNRVIFVVSGRNTLAAYYEVDIQFSPPMAKRQRHNESALRSGLTIGTPCRIDRKIRKLFSRSAPAISEAA